MKNIILSLKSVIPFSISLLFFPFLPFLASSSDPVPAPWPLQFHSLLFMNNTEGLLQAVDLWYDFPNGRNFNIIQNQLGTKLYDLEWDNGTSYYYTLDANKECITRHFPVGILRPNWLDGSNYLGRVYKDGFLCNVWEKVDFIWYYEDVDTKRPVYWAFYTGMVAHVMSFEVGAVLDDPNWQAPSTVFTKINSLRLDHHLTPRVLSETSSPFPCLFDYSLSLFPQPDYQMQVDCKIILSYSSKLFIKGACNSVMEILQFLPYNLA